MASQGEYIQMEGALRWDLTSWRSEFRIGRSLRSAEVVPLGPR
jgi:hypothetical protein